MALGDACALGMCKTRRERTKKMMKCVSNLISKTLLIATLTQAKAVFQNPDWNKHKGYTERGKVFFFPPFNLMKHTIFSSLC